MGRRPGPLTPTAIGRSRRVCAGDLAPRHVRVLEAVRAGAAVPSDVAQAAHLSLSTVLTVARDLRGPDHLPPRLLCALDGMPWALTLDGLRALEAL